MNTYQISPDTRPDFAAANAIKLRNAKYSAEITENRAELDTTASREDIARICGESQWLLPDQPTGYAVAAALIEAQAGLPRVTAADMSTLCRSDAGQAALESIISIGRRCEHEGLPFREDVMHLSKLALAERDALLAQNAALRDALTGIMEYAHDGARIRDVDPQEQPQFVAARAALALGKRSRVEVAISESPAKQKPAHTWKGRPARGTR